MNLVIAAHKCSKNKTCSHAEEIKKDNLVYFNVSFIYEKMIL